MTYQPRHGMTRTRVWNRWRCMRQHLEHAERWATFETFYADMGEPGPGQRMHRADPDRPFGPGNAEWMDDAESRSICATRTARRHHDPGIGDVQRQVLRVMARVRQPLRPFVIAGLAGLEGQQVRSALVRLRDRRRLVARGSDGGWMLRGAA